MKIRTICAAFTVMILSVSKVDAQISPFPDTFELTGEDIAAISEAFNLLMEDAAAAPGSTVDWSNEGTGSSGTVNIQEFLSLGPFEACRKIRYDIRIAKYQQLHRYVIDYCQVEDGTWKSYP